MRCLIAITTVAIVLLAAACGAPKSGLCDVNLAAAKPGDLAAAEAAAHSAWVKRADEAHLKQAITHWRQAVAIAPNKTKNYVRLARAIYFWGDGILRAAEREEEMLAAFQEATFVAERALQIQNKPYQLSVCAKEPFKVAAAKLRIQDVPAVYWYAVALGKYGIAKSMVLVLNNKDRIEAIMKRVRKLAPGYNHGAADRYLGAYYTKIPVGRPAIRKAKRHFQESIRRAPKYLATHVLIADMLAPGLKDKKAGRALAEKHLKFVMEAPVTIIKGLEAEAAIEKAKAKRLWEELVDIYED